MKVGVIGAGTMGSGIAQAFAVTDGYEVVLCDITEEFAAGGKKKIEKSLTKLVSKGKMEQEKADAILAKITTGLNDKVADCDLSSRRRSRRWTSRRSSSRSCRRSARRTRSSRPTPPPSP